MKVQKTKEAISKKTAVKVAKKPAPAEAAELSPEKQAKQYLSARPGFGNGRPPITDTVIPSREALELIRKGKFDASALMEIASPAPSIGRELKDTDSIRVSGSREFVLAVMPLFKRLFDQDVYDITCDTIEQRDEKKKPTGRYGIYVRIRYKKGDPRDTAPATKRNPKRKAEPATTTPKKTVKKVATKATPQEADTPAPKKATKKVALKKKNK